MSHPRPEDRQGYDPTLFQHSGRWDLSLDPKQQERVDLALTLIPQSTGAVLDVGCGNGMITRRMAKGRFVVGCDTSRRGLRDLPLTGVCGSLTCLPFKNASFDLVTAFEVLEHLPAALGRQACEEMARVARHHVLISVPNSEDLEARLTRCPRCRRPFHVYNHLTSFAPDDMPHLVPSYRLRDLLPTPHTRSGAEALPRWLRVAGIPLYTWAPNVTCPRCHATDFRPTAIQIWGLRLTRLLSGAMPRWRAPGGWILALYERMG